MVATTRVLDTELQEAGALGVAVDRGGDHVDPVHRQHARHATEDAGLVGHDQRQEITLRLDSPRTAVEERLLLRGEHVGRDVGYRSAPQHMCDPLHERGDQPGLPFAPGRRTSCARVGLGEGRQQFEQHGRADRFGNLLDRAGVVEVASGGHVGQQQVMLHHRSQQLHLVRRKSHARTDEVRQLDAPPRVIAGEPLSEIVQERADHE